MFRNNIISHNKKGVPNANFKRKIAFGAPCKGKYNETIHYIFKGLF